MTDAIEIQPCGPIFATIRPPGSKSITNRALVCAALAGGESVLSGALNSQDTRVMIDSLSRLGISIQHDSSQTELTVEGAGGAVEVPEAQLTIANSGTTVRFLTALATLGRGNYRLSGTARMHERPIADLLQALEQLGADTSSEGDNGCPPIVVRARGLKGGQCRIRGNISSQYLSAILMVAPYAREDVTILVDGELVSRPYVEMTVAVMRQFGVEVESASLDRFDIAAGQTYTPRAYAIEPDASAASYFLAAGAITGGEVTVAGLSRNSLQGDVRFAEVLGQMGASVRYDEQSISVAGAHLRGVDVEMNDISDTVQTLAAVALFAEGPTTIRGVAHNRYKETDRIADLATELRRVGASVDELADGLRITPGDLRATEIETYDDHRMAMSMALIGLQHAGIVIKDPACTEKTYPAFFDDLARLTAGAKK